MNSSSRSNARTPFWQKTSLFCLCVVCKCIIRRYNKNKKKKVKNSRRGTSRPPFATVVNLNGIRIRANLLKVNDFTRSFTWEKKITNFRLILIRIRLIFKIKFFFILFSFCLVLFCKEFLWGLFFLAVTILMLIFK